MIWCFFDYCDVWIFVYYIMKVLSGGEILVLEEFWIMYMYKELMVYGYDKDVEGFSFVVIYSCILLIIGWNNKWL